jgi:hypothetical protein
MNNEIMIMKTNNITFAGLRESNLSESIVRESIVYIDRGNRLSKNIILI